MSVHVPNLVAKHRDVSFPTWEPWRSHTKRSIATDLLWWRKNDVMRSEMNEVGLGCCCHINLYGYWFLVFYTFFMPLLFDSIFDSDGWQLPDIQSLHLYRTHKISLNSTESPTFPTVIRIFELHKSSLFCKPPFCKPQHRHPSLNKSPFCKWQVQVTPLAKPAPLLPSWKWRTKRLPCCKVRSEQCKYSPNWNCQDYIIQWIDYL